ncbi:type II toxin-antitoxin system RelE/ParE family toxin [Reichenbachiella carrageenanivorans]|uniref:type II toxin-antitoxin system RelE/ParE family toxin n=1 Tax=Reichenbachiella carrageenanivorans TaxID=2979869 RepID=UPI00389B1350
MAFKIIWSPLAQQKRKEILVYWKERNGNNSYSRKLNALFVEAVKLLSKFPNIGKDSDIKDVKVKIVRDYLLYRPEHINSLE